METKVCQSCGMRMNEESQLGKNKDGSFNEDYCKYCFDNGAFLKEETMEEMIETCVPFMVKEGMEEAKAREMMNELLPTLKRWSK